MHTFNKNCLKHLTTITSSPTRLIRLFITCLLICPIVAHSVTITVTSIDDDFINNDGDCNLREAISAANTNSAVDACDAGDGADIIVFDPVLTSAGATEINITPDSQALNLDESLEIQGPGADLMTIGGQTNALFGFPGTSTDDYLISGLTLANNLNSAIFIVNDEIKLVIEDMVFADNSAFAGGAIRVTGSQGTSTVSDVTIRRSTFSGNSATTSSGGAIDLKAPINLIIEDSTFVNNTSFINGSAIAASVGTPSFNVTIRRSTFSNNHGTSNDAAITFSAISFIEANILIEHTTITDNQCDINDGGTTSGLSIFGSGVSLTLNNNIIANNSCDGIVGNNLRLQSITSITTQGSNFIASSTSSFFPAGYPNINGDYVGPAVDPIDPDLAPLADNGGPTLTHLPNVTGTGAVIDKTVCADQALDQRGLGNDTTQNRAVDEPSITNINSTLLCDIGAVEVGGEIVIPPEPDDELCLPVKASNGAIAIICF